MTMLALLILGVIWAVYGLILFLFVFSSRPNQNWLDNLTVFVVCLVVGLPLSVYVGIALLIRKLRRI